MCGADEKDLCIFSGNGSTQAVNLLIEKLRVTQIVNQVAAAKASGQAVMSREEIEKDIAGMDFCEQNRFNSFTCRLCKTIMPSLAAYEKHA